MEGSFSLPLKYTSKWAWENTWGACSLGALVLIPWPLALLTVPHLMEVYGHSSVQALLGAVVFGVGWGVGGIFFGLGLAAVGLSLGLSLIMGLVAIGGSIIPLMMQHPEQLSRPPGLVLMGGIAIMILGIAVCAKAGQLKEKAAAAADSQASAGSSRKVRYGLGLFFCVAAGLLSALVNFALIFGANIADNAVRQGADPSAANNAVWALVFTANYAVNVGYCAYLAKRNKTFNKFLSLGTAAYWTAAIGMGLLWAGGIVIYGIGTTQLGHLGAILGFPVMLISSIITGNALGFLTGEWRGIGSQPRHIMAFGVFLLVIATVVIAYSNRLVA
jgi:L-rhamnose-H+ transport protein